MARPASRSLTEPPPPPADARIAYGDGAAPVRRPAAAGGRGAVPARDQHPRRLLAGDLQPHPRRATCAPIWRRMGSRRGTWSTGGSATRAANGRGRSRRRRGPSTTCRNSPREYPLDLDAGRPHGPFGGRPPRSSRERGRRRCRCAASSRLAGVVDLHEIDRIGRRQRPRAPSARCRSGRGAGPVARGLAACAPAARLQIRPRRAAPRTSTGGRTR